MKLVKMTRHDGHKVDVHPSMVEDYRKGAYVVDDDQGHGSQPAGIGTDSGDQFSDDQLRGAIEAATGKKPHHKLGREKLVEMFNELNAGT
jgi:hypothetical protein